jgi:hypothetical protein
VKNSKSLTHRSAAEPVASAMNTTSASANATVKSSAVNAANVVNPEALKLGKERFDVRDDFVIVLRVLPREFCPETRSKAPGKPHRKLEVRPCSQGQHVKYSQK